MKNAVLKPIFRIVVIFLIGTAGGIFGSQIIWPLLVERPLFYGYSLPQAPVYVTERKEIIVQENTALREAVEKVQKSVIALRSRNAAGRVLEGSGLVLTSDGLVLTLNELLPPGGEFVFLAAGREEPARYQVLKRDPVNNLVLIKLELGDLRIARFADFERLQLGERVFLVKSSVDIGPEGEFASTLGANEGVISWLSEEVIGTTMRDTPEVHGSPVFNIAGSVVGLSYAESDGRVNVIPVTILRSFAGL